ncbi:MAG: Hsp20/alpha crystallin family protein [Candidatus Doudnabacteria bacterium]|nr:Hsp20/alpha crystallin family protein [Candidatus Doudnabacteria bacterium]
MARKSDKSFFGKIMGGDVAEEETQSPSEEEGYIEEADVEVEELVAEGYEDDAEEVEDEEVYEDEEEQEPQTAAPVANGRDRKEEEWLSDYEGQLNIDMYQTKDNVIIKSTIAGVRPEDIDITVANDMVSIKGARRKEENVSQDDYFYQECYWGNFSRSVIVPVDIDSETIEADLKDGILTIIIPKAAKAKTKKVKVRGL